MGANCAAALKMPRNYVVMDMEEMTDTVGGETVVATLQDANDYF